VNEGVKIRIVSLALFIFTGLANFSRADEDLSFLDTREIRSAYLSAKTNWSDVPDLVGNAFVVSEDKNFFKRSPSRSTLTASLAFWYPHRGGKTRFALTIAFGQALERKEILDWYVHSIFLGQRCFGVDGAAIAYFGKSIDELALHELALLAALPQSPTQLTRIGGYDRILLRRNYILSEMAELGFISPAHAQNSLMEPLGLRDPLGKCAVTQASLP
jgi:membrane peptidoglycan carboxypeptidase